MQDRAAEPSDRPVPAPRTAAGAARRAAGQPDLPPFGAALRRHRLAAGLSQERLAKRAGLSARTVSDLERGVAAQPRLETVRLLVTALELPPAEQAALLAAARPTPPPANAAPAGPSAALLPLIGRARELEALDQFLAGGSSPAHDAPLQVLAGEPGIGKTRLLQAVVQRAIGQGWTVLEGGCHRQGGQAPYAPLLDALAQYLALRQPARQTAELAGCAWLGRLLPELAPVLEPLPAGALAPDQERRLVFAAVARFLANLAGPAGTLLVLDDVQWAGPDALDLLAALVRGAAPRPGAGARPLRVVGAYRDTEVRPTDPLGLLLADLAQARLVRQHTLGPLAPAEAADLLDALLIDLAAGERGQVEGVLRRAGGTPFFLVSYAQALHQGGAAGVPWDVTQGVRQRVALLPAVGRALLAAAAVAGRHVSRLLLVAVAGQPEEAVLAGLEAACRARLLVEEGDDAYAVAHDLIREVVEADLGTAGRAALHRRVAVALEAQPGEPPAGALAYHYGRGDAPDKAVLYLERAGDQAWTQRAHGAAEGHFREALARLETLGRVREAVRVREKLGEGLTRLGRYEAALQVLGPAADAYRLAGDWAGLGRVAAAMAEADFLGGASAQGLARLQPLLEQLERSGGSAPPAALYMWWGVLLREAGRYGEALAVFERAVEVARAGGDRRTLVRAATFRPDFLQRTGQLDEALRAYREVLTVAEAMGDLEALVAVHRDLAHIYTLRGDFAAGTCHIDQSLAMAEQLENPANRALTLAMRGWLAVLSGDARAAHADLDQALALVGQLAPSWYTPYVRTLWARLVLAEGSGATAAASLRETIALAEASGDLQAMRWAGTAMAEIEILEGRPAEARERLLPLLDRPGLEESGVTPLLPVLAWARLELGLLDQATESVEAALKRARPGEMRLVLVEALRVQALIALRRGHPTKAAGSLEEGVALARSMPYPYAEARLLQVYGALQAQLGDPNAARERLEAALARFTRLGAQRDRTDVLQAIGRLSQNDALARFETTDALARFETTDALARFETTVSETQWAQVEALLPPPARTGRRRADDRRTLEAILYVQRTGCAWTALPVVFGDEATAHRRLRQWQAAGLWEQIAAILQRRG